MDIIFDIKDIDQILDWFEADMTKTIVLQNSENLFHQCRYRSFDTPQPSCWGFFIQPVNLLDKLSLTEQRLVCQ